jgi:general L-amino acid transport system permease protein
MTDNSIRAPATKRASTSLIYDPKARSIFFQVLTLVILVALVWSIAHNVSVNLARSNTATGFGFLAGRSGFDIGQSLIAYTSDSTYGRAKASNAMATMVSTTSFGVARRLVRIQPLAELALTGGGSGAIMSLRT